MWKKRRHLGNYQFLSKYGLFGVGQFTMQLTGQCSDLSVERLEAVGKEVEVLQLSLY